MEVSLIHTKFFEVIKMQKIKIRKRVCNSPLSKEKKDCEKCNLFNICEYKA